MPLYWEDTLNATTKAFKAAADEVTVYCQIGMRASHDLFTLALIGHDLTKRRNYYYLPGGMGKPRRHPYQSQDTLDAIIM